MWKTRIRTIFNPEPRTKPTDSQITKKTLEKTNLYQERKHPWKGAQIKPVEAKGSALYKV